MDKKVQRHRVRWCRGTGYQALQHRAGITRQLSCPDSLHANVWRMFTALTSSPSRAQRVRLKRGKAAMTMNSLTHQT